jgi:flagellar biosynthetic protein FliR
MQLFVVTLMLAADAHLVIIDAVAASLQRLPLGGTVDATAGIGAMLSLGTTVFTLGVRMAAPVMAAVLVGNVALAVLSRAAPQLNVLTVAFPLQIGLGLFTLCAALPVIAMQFVSWSRAYDGVLTQLVSALATGGR